MKVSDGCKHCYAESSTFVRVQRKEHERELWGLNAERHITSPAAWSEPLRWNRRAKKTGVRERVFCASLADVFEARADLDVARAWLLSLIVATPNLDWQLLTKRPENIRAALSAAAWHPALTDEARAVVADWLMGHPPANVWLGTSVENQKAATARIPHLVAMPAAVRFLSMEPLLEAVDISDALAITCPICHGNGALVGGERCARATYSADGTTFSHPQDVAQVHWIIVGGESGPAARPFDVAWARYIIKQRELKGAGVAVFIKQLGENAKETRSWSTTQKQQQLGRIHVYFSIGEAFSTKTVITEDKKGGDINEWPEDIRVREMPR